MTIAVFDRMFNEIIGVEGGFQCDPKDRGNWTSGKVGIGECKGTKYGVSAMAYPSLDIKNITEMQARAIFKKDYWDRICGDLLPDSLAIVVSDFAYNSGSIRAVKCLQKLLGVTIDGKIGNQTIGASHRLFTRKIVKDYCNARLDFLSGLKTFKIYGKGWIRRVNHIQAVAEEYL